MEATIRTIVIGTDLTPIIMDIMVIHFILVGMVVIITGIEVIIHGVGIMDIIGTIITIMIMLTEEDILEDTKITTLDLQQDTIQDTIIETL